MRLAALSLLLGGLASTAALAESETRVVPRQPFAAAHVQYMARAQRANAPASLSEVDVWAEGTRLKAVIAGDSEQATYWVDGLASHPLRLVKGQVAAAKAKTLAQGLELAFRAAPDQGNQQNDRVAGKPCRIVSEKLKGGVTLRRCFWRGIPLSVELSSRTFDFNLAATLVEEGKVAVAHLQPPLGAPAAPASLNAAR